MDKHSGDLPQLNHILKLRKSESDMEKDGFHFYWMVLLETVTTKSMWKQHKLECIVSDKIKDGDSQIPLVTVSDEAFCLFMFENWRENFMAIWKNSNSGTNLMKIHVPGPRYSQRRGNTSDLSSPWNVAGDLRYNELFNLVKRDRADDKNQTAERLMLAQLREENGLSKASEESFTAP